MRRYAAAALAGALLWSGCGGEPSPDADREVLRGPDASRRVVTPARFVTDVTFVPFGTDPAGVHFRFSHLTSAEALERDYGAWKLEDDAWEPALRVRDTLPVPRAGWRILPAEGLRVLVGDGGDLQTLVRTDSVGAERLELGETLAEWSGPTGQGERLRRARHVATDGTGRAGLAVERRRAQGRDVPPSRGLYGFLLVTDSAGDGLVVRRHGGTPPGREPPAVDSAAVGHGVLEGEPRSWPGIRLSREGAAGSGSPPPSGWSLEVPGVAIRGRLRPGPRVEVAAPAPGDGSGGGAPADSARAVNTRPVPDPVRVYYLSGTLRVLGEERPVRGIGVETGEP